ncbi:MAG: fasciclin domain-containing protein [Lentimicrobiaceae bacterium]|jgi:transforming growth factor-beta-induced protein|nr:fasciclin domain-containing protein [Lentimicrobiaceae bacterium]MCP4910240.1 fasciclin domain-containing protein [Bacteroidota bacterium]MBT3455349.1 fasciclin domain-containing protein [Lentimicrobiaceae bacterium]MBT3818811.1 fasciclin domain-containing protein [Lentimicrobiaceae bacterium]MBT4062078.1 fasciclin domain-containing protein [Lentimicrobiaceae bacterium]
MKTQFLTLALLISSSLIFAGCNKDDDNDPTPVQPDNIVQIAQASGFNSLATALTIAGLDDDLQGAGPFTVFAPTDEAFAALLGAIGQTDINDVPVEVLQQILLYHVVPSSVISTQLQAGMVQTLQGTDVTVSISSGIMVNDANVIMPYDVIASNGVIHTIDQVLVPAAILQFVNTVLEPAYFNKNFSTLIAAAVKADLVTALLTTPNLTIFAPTNDAFNAAGINPENIDAATLGAVLTYHVVGAKVLSSDIPREASTLNGNNIYFSLTESGNFINGSTEIVGVDIESGSGVVHVINNVLLPPVGNIVETAVALTEDGEFTSLVAALQRTANEGTPEQNLISVLSSNGPFTVFAPTNAAFQALLDSSPQWNSLNDIPLDVLISVLTYHVVSGRAYSTDLPGILGPNGDLATVQGQNISINLANLTINETSKIIAVNTNATNGVIHVIDAVLLPN